MTVVAGLGVSVTSTVLVVSGPSTVFVDIMTWVIGGRVSVSTTVFVVGACVCTIVSIMVAAACKELSAEVAAAPPSTATTEYVALLTKGTAHSTFRGTNGNDEDNKKSDDKTKSEEVEVLRRIMMILTARLRESYTFRDSV